MVTQSDNNGPCSINGLLKIGANLGFDQVLAYDKTAVWFYATSDTTHTRKGESMVSMKTTGHKKMNITVGLLLE